MDFRWDGAARSDAIAHLGKLMEIGIDYPYNTMLRVIKRVGVTKRLAYRAAELWQAQNGGHPCTAYDLYLGICEAEFLLQCDGASAPRVAQMEENISRALKVRWEEYDYEMHLAQHDFPEQGERVYHLPLCHGGTKHEAE